MTVPVPRELVRFTPSKRIGVILYTLAFISLSTFALWPIFGDFFLAVTVLGGCAIGFGLRFVHDRFRLSALTVFLVGMVAVGIGVLPFSNPGGLTSINSVLPAWQEALLSLVYGWKQLITIDIPVGVYQSLLAPVFLVFVVAGYTYASTIWGRASRYWMSVLPFFATVAGGISFGGSAVPRSTQLGIFEIPVPPALIFGSVCLLVAIAYLAWAGEVLRRGAATATAQSRAVRSQGMIRRLRRVVAAGIVLAIAATLAGGYVLISGAGSVKDVLRTAVDPLVLIKRQISPLSTYRQAFVDPNRLEAEQLSVQSTGDLPARIRVAVMPYFDGEAFRVASDAETFDESSVFSRLPWSLPAASLPTGTRTLDITYTSPEGSPWLPSVDDLKSISFSGDGAGTLDGALYVNRTTHAAVIIPASEGQLTYSVEQYLIDNDPSLESITSVGEPTIDEALIPDSLTEWVQTQDVVIANAADLSGLIGTLRARGYLSHSLEEPVAEAGKSNWVAELSGYNFEPSLSGHSTSRASELFLALNTREKATNSTEDSKLVAAIGDDEQFATAAALIASELGFPARVVLGYKLIETGEDVYSVPACDNGVCTGRNLTAWVEVQGSNGSWVSLDATPQFQNPIAPQSTERQDPKNETTVTIDEAEVLAPPVANPATGATDQTDPGFSLDLAWLWSILLTVLQWALVTAIVLSPFVLILWVKRRRRHERFSAELLDERIVGAWDEYMDLRVDYGAPIRRYSTRREIVADVDDLRSQELAQLADEAAFADYYPPNESATRAWTLVDEAAAELRNSGSWLQRVRANLSLKSFVRQLSTRDQVRLVQGALAFTNARPGGSESTALDMTRSMLKTARRGLFGPRRPR
jgi:hypothetical protein